MSENNDTKVEQKDETTQAVVSNQAPTESKSQVSEGLKLDGLYVFKMGMATIFENGESVPVTLVRYEPMVVSQVKTKEKDGYTAVQVVMGPKKAKRTTLAEKNNLKNTGFENGAYFTKEIRQELPEGVSVGQKISIESFAQGDFVKVRSKSKGRGFAGAVKRYRFSGGPKSHGFGFDRRVGSVGMREWPGRILKGKRMPGHYGDKNFTVRNLRVVDVIPQDNVLIIKGAIPGAQNTLVHLTKEKANG